MGCDTTLLPGTRPPVVGRYGPSLFVRKFGAEHGTMHALSCAALHSVSRMCRFRTRNVGNPCGTFPRFGGALHHFAPKRSIKNMYYGHAISTVKYRV